MRLRLTEPVTAAAAKAGMSVASAYRIQSEARLPSQKSEPRGRRRADPLIDIFDAEVVPMLAAAPGIRAVTVFEELMRRYPELPRGVRRTLERRIRTWRKITSLSGPCLARQARIRRSSVRRTPRGSSG